MDCLSPVSFWTPQYLPYSAWQEHAPFAFWITSVLAPRTIVELGTHTGFSYFAFCQAVQRTGSETRCFAVDTWRGDEHAGLYGLDSDDVFERVTRHNNLHYSEFSRLVRSTFDEALPHFPDASIDLLHIDGRHFFEDVTHDFATWLPKLSERAVVLFHDTNVRERGFGVFRFWAEVSNKFPHFEFFHGHGLGILGVGREVPGGVLPLFTASALPATATEIRTVYNRLGGAVRASFEAENHKQELEVHSAQVTLLQKQQAVSEGLHSALVDELEAVKKHNATVETDLGALLQHQAAGEKTKSALTDELFIANKRYAAVEAGLAALQQRHSALERGMAERVGELDAARRARAVLDRDKIALKRELAAALARIAELERHSSGAVSKKNGKRAERLRKFARPFFRILKRGATSLRRKYFGGSETIPGLKNLASSEVARVVGAFDRDYYLEHNPDVAASRADPFEHYMVFGWKERRDPSHIFSTAFYLRQWPDIAAAGINPFVHWVLYGIEENRVSLSFRQRLDRIAFLPKVSAIVPNYNHARFLARRIESILSQSYANVDVLILDDGSTDESRGLIEQYCRKYPDRIRALFNDENTGNVFKQWRKGVENTDGELVWICESDDFCEPDFVERLVPNFLDESVNIAFGRVLETGPEGDIREGLDGYREGAEAGIWGRTLVRPAREWFANGFGVNNVVVNVGGSMWRRVTIPDPVWRETQSYSVVGDWFLYCHVAGGGQIAWEPNAISYFRRHGSNTSVTSFVRPIFYQELERLMLTLRHQWDVPDRTVEKFYAKVVEQYAFFDLGRKFGPLESYCNKRKLLAAGRTRPHVLMVFYGFIAGGGEVFPLNLANQLHASGWLVSMLALEMTSINADMKAALDPGIAVYDSAWVAEYGVDRFIAEAGVSLIHSHTVGAEFRFFENWKMRTKIPYLVTLHGSYEASEFTGDRVVRLASGVSHFVYTADKNLEPFRGLGLPRAMFTKLPNAMPVDALPFPRTRQDLGIAADAVVFTLVARGIRRKGWRTSIAAFVRLRAKYSDRAMHLLLCGDGDEPDRYRVVHGDDPDITFLGYQARVHGLYRLSDVAIVPTRFAGESFPLCIIQALQAGTPVIGSRVGEIETMLASPEEAPAGIVIDAVRETNAFIDLLEGAMEEMLNPERRQAFSGAAGARSRSYSMDELADAYGALYGGLLENTDRSVLVA